MYSILPLEDVQNMIFKQANKAFHKLPYQYGSINIDDLVQQGYMVYYKTIKHMTPREK